MRSVLQHLLLLSRSSWVAGLLRQHAVLRSALLLCFAVLTTYVCVASRSSSIFCRSKLSQAACVSLIRLQRTD
jgi:hypothetical protein